MPEDLIRYIFSFLEDIPRISRDFLHHLPKSEKRILLLSDIYIHGGSPCFGRYCICKVVTKHDRLEYYNHIIKK